MREVENLPFGPTARWTSLNLVGSFDRPPPGVSDLAWSPSIYSVLETRLVPGGWTN